MGLIGPMGSPRGGGSPPPPRAAPARPPRPPAGGGRACETPTAGAHRTYKTHKTYTTNRKQMHKATYILHSLSAKEHEDTKQSEGH